MEERKKIIIMQPAKSEGALDRSWTRKLRCSTDRPGGFYSLSIVSRRHAGTTTQVQHTLSLRRVMSWRFGPAEVLDIYSTAASQDLSTGLGMANVE